MAPVNEPKREKPCSAILFIAVPDCPSSCLCYDLPEQWREQLRVMKLAPQRRVTATSRSTGIPQASGFSRAAIPRTVRTSLTLMHGALSWCPEEPMPASTTRKPRSMPLTGRESSGHSMPMAPRSCRDFSSPVSARDSRPGTRTMTCIARASSWRATALGAVNRGHHFHDAR